MMKLVPIFVLLCTVNADVSHILGLYGNRPVGPASKSLTLRQEQDIKEDGSYSYYYETANGIVGHEDANPLRSPDSGTSTSGGYHYTSPEGKLIVVSYTADENGFHPSGDVVPKVSSSIK